MLARAHQQQRPVLAAGQRAARQRGEQPGPDDRRLAAAGRADDAEQRRADELRDEVGDEPLAPAEVVGVGRLERCEALERADHEAGRRPPGRARSGAAARRRRPARPPSSAAARVRRLPLRRARRRAAPPRPRPLGGDPVHARGDALGGGPEQLGGDLVRIGAGDERRRDRADRLDADRPELDRGVGPRAVHRRGARGDREDQHGQVGERARQRVEAAHRVGICRVDVVEHQQRRALRDARPVDRAAQRPVRGRRRRRRARCRRAGGPPPRARRRRASARSRAAR